MLPSSHSFYNPPFQWSARPEFLYRIWIKLRHRGNVRVKIFSRWLHPALKTSTWCRWERVT
jgi:hypothetical protein